MVFQTEKPTGRSNGAFKRNPSQCCQDGNQVPNVPIKWLSQIPWPKKKNKLLADDTSAWIWLSKQVFTERPPFLKLSHIISCKTSKYYPNSWQSPTVQVVMPFGSCLKTLK